MKQRVVINCQDCIKNIQNPNSGITVDDLDYDVEQIPETFEELKELCKEFGEIEIIENNIYFRGMTFRLKGDVEDFEGNIIGENRTPAQMWEIIKSLTKQEEK